MTEGWVDTPSTPYPRMNNELEHDALIYGSDEALMTTLVPSRCRAGGWRSSSWR